MPNGVKTVDQKCPYRTVVRCVEIKCPRIEERFDFQFTEKGVDRVSLGKFDLIEEVQSHKHEAGLINFLTLAEARATPLDSFAKKEPGLMVDVGDVDTLDDMIQIQKQNQAKLEAMAAQYGMTLDELVGVIQSGDYSKLDVKEEVKQDGEN